MGDRSADSSTDTDTEETASDKSFKEEQLSQTHFQTLEWANKYFAEPSRYQRTYIEFLRRKQSTEDSFLATTLSTPQGIQHCIAFHDKSAETLSHTPSGCIHVLFNLGKGLCGHPGVSHGGFVAVLIDESMGFILKLQYPTRSVFTATLEIQYLRPLQIPGCAIAKTWIAKSEGRKMWVDSLLQTPQGEDVAKGRALFIEPRLRL